MELIKRDKKTKIDLVEDYKSKIWRFEIQPKFMILVEFWGLLTSL
jgi:hypothetical protein